MSFYGKLSPWGRCKTACWLRSALSPQPSLFCKGLEINKNNKHINCSCTITASVRKDAGWVHGLYWSEFLGKRLAPLIQCLWRKQGPEVHLYKVFPEHFVRMLLTEGEKKNGMFWFHWIVFCQNESLGKEWGWGRGTVVQAKCSWRGHGWPFLPIFLRMSTLNNLFLLWIIWDIRIPLLITHSFLRIPLEVAHSPLVPKEFRNKFFLECGMTGLWTWPGSWCLCHQRVLGPTGNGGL